MAGSKSIEQLRSSLTSTRRLLTSKLQRVTGSSSNEDDAAASPRGDESRPIHLSQLPEDMLAVIKDVLFREAKGKVELIRIAQWILRSCEKYKTIIADFSRLLSGRGAVERHVPQEAPGRVAYIEATMSDVHEILPHTSTELEELQEEVDALIRATEGSLLAALLARQHSTVKSFYHDLDASKLEIRLIRIDGHCGSNPRCTMRTFSISPEAASRPEWKALSYCWGHGDATESIILNGQIFRVRRTLHEFLSLMADEKMRDWIFIDAICINQGDLEERAAQVQLMREVYAAAMEVIVWIFPQEEFGKPRAKNRKYIPYAVVDEWTTELENDAMIVHRDWTCPGRHVDQLMIDAIFARLVLEEIDLFGWHFEWTGFRSVIASIADDLFAWDARQDDRQFRDRERSLRLLRTRAIYVARYDAYWSRLWIVQELLLTQRASFRVGNLRLDRADFVNDQRDEIVGIEEDPFELLGPDPESHRIHMARILTQHLESPTRPRWTFAQVSTHTSRQSCHDFRDRVFGLLGITPVRISVDYSITRQALFVALWTEYLLSLGGGLATVRHYGGGHTSVGDADITALYANYRALTNLAAPHKSLGVNLMDPVVFLLTREVLSSLSDDPLVQNYFSFNLDQSWFAGKAVWRMSELPVWLFGSQWQPLWDLVSRMLLSCDLRVGKPARKLAEWRHRRCAARDAPMTFACPEGKTTLRYSEWTKFAQDIFDDIWRKYAESGLDFDGELDDEPWVLVA